MFYKCFKYSLILILAISFFHAERAEASTGLIIQPVKISHTLEPGESISGIINLTNSSDEDVLVETKIEDFIPTAGSGGIKFVGRTEGLTTVRDWIKLGGEQNFIFSKKASKKIPYAITAPENAEPGSHFGVAFFKASKIEDASQLKIGTQVGVLIFITVPGNFLQKGNILDFQGPKFRQKGPVNFTIKFENTGTVHFEPKGHITISNMLGKEVGKISVQGQSVLPTGVRDLSAVWNTNKFLFGKYKATLEIKDGEGNVLTADSISFYALPIWHILGYLLLITIIFFILKFLRDRINFSISLKK